MKVAPKGSVAILPPKKRRFAVAVGLLPRLAISGPELHRARNLRPLAGLGSKARSTAMRGLAAVDGEVREGQRCLAAEAVAVPVRHLDRDDPAGHR